MLLYCNECFSSIEDDDSDGIYEHELNCKGLLQAPYEG